MRYDPSSASYIATSALGAVTPLVAATPAAASLLPVAHAAAEAAPWWGPLLVSASAGVAGPILLWIAKTILGGALSSAAAALRAWAASIRSKAKSTPSKDDDAEAEIRAAAIDAAARKLEESGANIPFKTQGE